MVTAMRVLLEKQNATTQSKAPERVDDNTDIDFLSSYLLPALFPTVQTEPVTADDNNTESYQVDTPEESVKSNFPTEVPQSLENIMATIMQHYISDSKQTMTEVSSQAVVLDSRQRAVVEPPEVADISLEKKATTVDSHDQAELMKAVVDERPATAVSQLNDPALATVAKLADGNEVLTQALQKLVMKEPEQRNKIKIPTTNQTVEAGAMPKNMKEVSKAEAEADTPLSKPGLEQKFTEWLTNVNNNQLAAVPAQPLNNGPNTQAQTIVTQTVLQEGESKPSSDSVSKQLSFHLDEMKEVSNQPGTYAINIRVNPVELGPMTAKLKITNNKVELEIVTKNHQTEQAVKANLPALLEQFNKSAMVLDNINVHFVDLSGSSSQQQHESSAQAMNDGGNELDDRKDNQPQLTENKKNKSDKLIDAYI